MQQLQNFFCMYTWKEDLALLLSSALLGRMRTTGSCSLRGTICFSSWLTAGAGAVPLPKWGGDLSGFSEHSRNTVDQDLASSAMETVRDSPQDPNSEGHFQFRIILLGDAAVGKSSLLHCFADRLGGSLGEGPDGAATPGPTVGIEFYSWTILMPPTGKVRLQLWDTAGQEQLG